LVHNTTRTVRRGRRFSFFMIRSASHVTMQPPPSSVAPAPTSHESRCPLTTTILSGFSRPRNSPTTLADVASASKCASIFNRTTMRLPRSAMRCKAVGVLGCNRGRRNLW
jgi:hypothetical protein